MKFSKRSKYLLFGLLVALNIIIRIPSVPHECTDDSYAIHTLANSISLFGEARWWLHPLSIGGFYPYSYASSVPFLLSGISQCTGMDMEWTIWLFSLVGGVFSMFAAYLMAGAIKDNDLFKFLVAFAYSLSPGILLHSTFNASTRGLFTMLLPLFIYLLLKTRNYLRNIVLIFILFVLLLVTHHYIYFTIPVILAYAVLLTFGKLKEHVRFIKIPTNYTNIAFIACFLGILLMPFFTRLFIAGSRYNWLNLMIVTNMRYTGILFAFALSGFVYLTLKANKKFEEWFLLLTLLCFAALLYILTYAHFFMAIFFCILAGVALTNIAKAPKQKKKTVAIIIIISLLLAVGFSGFYQHWRTHKYGGRNEWYMRETTNAGALWIKDNIDKNKNLVGNGGSYNVRAKRMFAASGSRPSILVSTGISALVYGFINESYIVMKKNSPLTKEFYWDNPYVEVGGKSIGGQLNWFSQQLDIDGRYGKQFIKKFNLSYMIESTDIHDPIIRSVQEKKDNIYDNGEIRIWTLY